MRIDPKGWVLQALFSRWPARQSFESGYTLLLPSPMDMPFLLRYALEGIAAMDTSQCRQILVVPDGWGDDGGAALRQVVHESADPRVSMVELSGWNTFIIHQMRPPGSAATHWQLVINGTKHAKCEYCFLHDADAFFLESQGLEKQYAEAAQSSMYALGVTPRWDPFFEKIQYSIPGTWELMYSARWARSRSPYALKGRWNATAHGWNEFDSMLYPMYLDYPTGKIGVMREPPRFVHFNGTIFSYRIFRDRKGQPIVDEFFRVLLLAILEELMPAVNGTRVVPRVAELAKGLTDATAPVRYDTAANVAKYPEFRKQIREMCDSPIFAGNRAERVIQMLKPYDEHFAKQPHSTHSTQLEVERRLRTHAMGG